MTRHSLRLLPPSMLAIAAATAFAQAGAPPTAPPGGTPGGYAPPGGATANVTGNTPDVSEQVEQMRRHINGERAQGSSSRADRARAATPADIVAGATVKDPAGAVLGSIESVDSEGAVIATGTGRARIPLNAFGVNHGGLLLQVSKAQFDASVAQANATPS